MPNVMVFTARLKSGTQSEQTFCSDSGACARFARSRVLGFQTALSAARCPASIAAPPLGRASSAPGSGWAGHAYEPWSKALVLTLKLRRPAAYAALKKSLIEEHVVKAHRQKINVHLKKPEDLQVLYISFFQVHLVLSPKGQMIDSRSQNVAQHAKSTRTKYNQLYCRARDRLVRSQNTHNR